MSKKKNKKAAVELTLWDVCLSYPDLHDPKPYKGKIYYKTDILMDEDHSQLDDLKAAIRSVRVDSWGEDKAEWPEGAAKAFILDGDEREDSAGYSGKFYLTASTQTPVPVVDLKNKDFNPQTVRGGMFANVAIRVSAWEYDGDEGMSIYLQAVQIDTSKPSLNFGGGKSVKQMFSRDGIKEDNTRDESGDDDDDQPRKSNKKAAKNFDDDDDE